jgi:hypothetical protein
VTVLLDEARLREQAVSRHPGLFADIARGWVADLPVASARIRQAGADDLPAALHELRSRAVPVGLSGVAGALAALEQRAERGDPPSPGEIDEALALAERSGAALDRWWGDHPESSV